MTALKKYARLESLALWRPNPAAQRREVVVAIGKSTLIIRDPKRDAALSHWSLAALGRRDTADGAVFHPETDPGETLELPPSEAEMIAAIETLRQSVLRRRVVPGRVRWLAAVLFAAGLIALLAIWLPGALRGHALTVIPDVKRAELDDAIIARLTRVSGPVCTGPDTETALARLAARTGVSAVKIVPEGPAGALLLPGGTVLLNRRLVEDTEDPHVTAGHILVTQALGSATAVLDALLRHAGMRGTATMLATGRVPDRYIDSFLQDRLSAPAPAPDPEALLARFEALRLPSSPYGQSLEPSQPGRAHLIDGDPMAGEPSEALMLDADWIRLQAICATQ